MHSLVGSVKVNAVRRIALVWFAAVVLVACPAALRSAQRPADDRLAEDAAVLAHAVAALSDKDRPVAAKTTAVLTEKLDKVGKQGSGLADYAALLMARLLAASAPERATSILSGLLTEHRDSPLRDTAAADLAGLLVEQGRGQEVLALAASHGRTDSPDAARICLEAGKVLARSKPAQALDLFLQAREKAPGSETALAAAGAMDTIRSGGAAGLPADATALLREARVEGRAGRWQKQSPLLERFLVRHGSHGRVVDATVDLSLAVARTKGRLAAAIWMDQHVESAHNERQRARYLFEAAVHRWNGNHSSDALEGFGAMLALGSGIEQEQNAHYASGRIHETARRYTAAAASYRSSSSGADAGMATESAWRAGWVSYLAGNFSGAAWVFSKVAEANNDATSRAPALYWKARSLERDGRKEEARPVYAALLKRFPDGYYAYMAEKRSGLNAVAPKFESGQAVVTINENEKRRIERARALHAVGLDGWARLEIETLLGEVSLKRQAALLTEAAKRGAYSTALRKAFELHRRGIISAARLNAYIFPKAYADIVVAEAARHSIEPALVWALMRQESAFDAQAVSPAAAYGLMQLLVPTAQRIAPLAHVKGAVSSDRLFRPEVNIALGTAYLAKLAGQFDSDPVLMLAGYNAGERASQRWQERFGHLDEDEFIESISYRETRDYVKKVLRNLRNYRRLARDGSAAGQGLEQSSR